MDKIFLINDNKILLKKMKISLYDRYISFEKKLSDVLFDSGVNALDFKEKDNDIIFFPGYMFEIRRKANNAVIYSKILADYLRDRLSKPRYEGVQIIYVSYSKEYFIIPTNSNNFLL